MRTRLPLYTKVLFLAFLNLALLSLVLVLLARAQFRLDPGSFLLAPAQDRILAIAHTLALELDDTPPARWDTVLARYGQANRVELILIDEDGERVAGPDLQPPRDVVDRIPRRGRPRGGQPPREGRPREKADEPPRDRRSGAPPLFLTASSSPTRYWAGVRVPVRRDRAENPKPGTLVMMAPSLLTNPLFFDPKPWLTAMLAVVAISVACWLPFIRGVTRSIAHMTHAASQIAEGQFQVHVSDRRRDEIGRLGAAINRMAARLDGFVSGQKRFLGGIAHELCNPIATIQFGLGNLERRVGDEHRESVADIEDEVQHMSALVNELLSFSRAGIQGVEIKLAPVNLAATVSRALDREAAGGVAIESAVDERLEVMADPEYLFRAVSNIVRNAVRYAGGAGPIEIAARRDEAKIRLTIADHGPGVPQETVDEIFSPFYRVDPSRNHDTGGVGLGLAIVKACIEACRGAVRCRNRMPSGLEIEIELAEAKS